MVVWAYIPFKDCVQQYALHVGCLHSGAILLFTAGGKKVKSMLFFWVLAFSMLERSEGEMQTAALIYLKMHNRCTCNLIIQQ